METHEPPKTETNKTLRDLITFIDRNDHAIDKVIASALSSKNFKTINASVWLKGMQDLVKRLPSDLLNGTLNQNIFIIDPSEEQKNEAHQVIQFIQECAPLLSQKDAYLLSNKINSISRINSALANTHFLILNLFASQFNINSRLSEEVDQAKAFILDQKEQTETQNNEYRDQLSELKDKLGIIETTYSTQVLKHHAKAFSIQAQNHEREFRIIQKSLIFLISLTLIIGGAYIVTADRHLYIDAVFIATMSAKILISGVMIYAAIKLTHLLFSAQHTSIIYKHKALSLETFDTMMKSNSDETVRYLLLIEAAKTIYANPETGLIRDQGDNKTEPRILAMLEKLTSKDRNSNK